MWDNCTENSSPVSREECDEKLKVLWIAFLWLSQCRSVHPSYRSLKGHELYHCVRDLSTPKWNDTLIKSIPSLSWHYLIPCSSKVSRESTSHISLDFNFDSLEGAKECVSDDFSTCRWNGESYSLVLLCVFFSYNSLVNIFEHLIKAKFSKSLKWISNQSGEPPNSESTKPFLCIDCLESIWNRFVNLCIDLANYSLCLPIFCT